MSLKNQVTQYLITNLFQPIYEPGKWKVLILDSETTKFISSAVDMKEITENGITLVESINVKRQPLNMEVIYIIDTSVESLNYISKDFNETSKMYPALHLFILQPYSKDFLKNVEYSTFRSSMKTFKQLDLSFIAIESHVYSLDERELWKNFFKDSSEEENLEKLANRMVTLCSLIGEHPKIVFKKDEPKIKHFAEKLNQKLNEVKSENTQMGRLPHQDRSVLLILDRSIDPIAPLMHYATLQAFAYDAFKPENNQIKMDDDSSFDLTDREDYWSEFRHEHIGNFDSITDACKKKFNSILAVELMRNKPQKGPGHVNEGADLSPEESSVSISKLHTQLKASGQYNLEMKSYENFIKVITKILSDFDNDTVSIAQMEQKLLHENIDMNNIGPLLMKKDDHSEKARILLYFMLTTDNEFENDLIRKVFSFSGLPAEYHQLILSASKLIKARLVKGENCNDENFEKLLINHKYQKLQTINQALANKPEIQNFLPRKGKRIMRMYDDFEISKYPPFLEDILEYIIDGKLDKLNQFETLQKTSEGNLMSNLFAAKGGKVGEPGTIMTARNRGGGQNYGQKTPSSQSNSKDSNLRNHVGPRIIVCMLGGLCWGEIRSVYNINRICIKARLDASEKAGKPEENKKYFGIFSDNSMSKSNSTHQIPNGGNIGWNWEVIAGGTHLISSKDYIDDLFDIYKSSFEVQPMSIDDSNPF